MDVAAVLSGPAFITPFASRKPATRASKAE
jgi:hypothetical protein